MSTDCRRHRLDGLEPGNLLAFLALLGVLRALEEAAPAWLPKVAWSVDEPPVRPLLSLSAPVSVAMIAATAATGVTRLAERHDFGARKDLRLSVDAATEQLRAAVRSGDSYTADLWAALVSDAAVRERNKVKEAEPTPLCLMFGQGHQHFLERLSVVPREASFSRGSGGNEQFISPTACLTEALFVPWARPDAMPSFRWDPHEDVRYALRAADPTTAEHQGDDPTWREPSRRGRPDRADGGFRSAVQERPGWESSAAAGTPMAPSPSRGRSGGIRSAS